ncbi:cohesin domain-containing protein [Desulfobacter latus]|uniref:Cohesin domain-containing protein n=1 Tax=Desulfobacter latus TaxID=2292 RepID=A0A850TC78_9BACT|nr:cohesin domain-containing protein [Desulfobacter latus]NWH04986.1 hypothetical protein [Desulfobacter latus]
MKNYFCIFILICSFLVIISPSLASGSNNSKFFIETSENKINIDDTLSASLEIESIQPVYGLEFIVTYDPKHLRPIDADPKKSGFQITPGSFFDLDRKDWLYPLQNRVDVNAGEIFFATSRLNPAPSASGDGIIANINFQAIKKGKTQLTIEKVVFGTKKGEAVKPETQNKMILITPQYFSTLHFGLIIGLTILAILILMRYRKRIQRDFDGLQPG